MSRGARRPKAGALVQCADARDVTGIEPRKLMARAVWATISAIAHGLTENVRAARDMIASRSTSPSVDADPEVSVAERRRSGHQIQVELVGQIRRVPILVMRSTEEMCRQPRTRSAWRCGRAEGVLREHGEMSAG